MHSYPSICSTSWTYSSATTSSAKFLFNRSFRCLSALPFRLSTWNGSRQSQVAWSQTSRNTGSLKKARQHPNLCCTPTYLKASVATAGNGILTPVAPTTLDPAPAWRFRRSSGPDSGCFSTAFKEVCVEKWMVPQPYFCLYLCCHRGA
jgi:hypothetical protein